LWNTFTGYVGVKDVRLVRDRITLASRGFCFVEFHSMEEAKSFMSNAVNIRVDGRFVKMVYSKGKNEEGGLNSMQAKNRPPLVIQDAASIIKNKDLSLFVYDPTYGYYFHSGSGLYYNPKDNYYWDSINQIQYLYDTISNDYLPPPPPPSTTTATSTSSVVPPSNDTSSTPLESSVEGSTENSEGNKNESSSSNSVLDAIQKSESNAKKEIPTIKKISITLPTKKVSIIST
jgi:hypothetical protein